VIENYFGLSKRGTDLRREAVAGLTTFLTMAYITFVNPQILSAAGMDQGAVFVATCLAAAFSSALMGLYANLPIALAPGMGLNAYFAFTVVPAFGGDWRLGLGAVFLSGVAMLAISLSPLRAWFVNAIPRSLKLAIASGIGFFLALIGFENAGIVIANPATLVSAGDFASPELWIAAAGFVVIAVLAARGVRGAVLIGIIAASIAAAAFGLTEIGGIVSAPPSLGPTFLQMDILGALSLGPLIIVFVFLMVDLLDTSGTLTAVAHQAGLLDENGHLPQARRALVADSSATIVGAALGTSTTTSYIESAAGIEAGGRTGLTAVVVALLFLFSLFLSPLAASIPAFATAPALIFVAALMAKGIAEIDWRDVTEAAPALITALAIPFTFSIATGIGLGFISYALIKLLSGRGKDLNASVVVIAVLFAIKLAIE
jgi:AGZA family xanthine/uracil permease-like MFS transporter